MDEKIEELKILQIDNEEDAKILLSVSERVGEIDKDTEKLVNDLKKEIGKIGSGFGLAAPQIGVLKRVIILLDISGNERKYIELINPIIVSSKGKPTLGEEACFSVDYAHRKKLKLRYDNVVVKYQTLSNETITKSFYGWIARAVQHEIDHLNGKLIDKPFKGEN